MRDIFQVAFKIAPMNLNDTLHCLEVGWQKYLKNRGHYIYRGEIYLPVIRSRNHKKGRYHWLLLVGHGLKRTLSKPELSTIHQHLKQAKKQKEAAYLVVGFIQEPRRVVILPAETALKTGYIRSDKGGIAWED
ncbi:MAG: hypothetical protein GY774_17835 [Planctomycetes bacterium]|nr:hypothetical protein [Planctomycetota bacterium]